jgi:cell division protein FtsI/penicillin-binding protein 2
MTTSSSAPTDPQPARRRRRAPLVIALCVVLVLALGGTGYLVLGRGGNGGDQARALASALQKGDLESAPLASADDAQDTYDRVTDSLTSAGAEPRVEVESTKRTGISTAQATLTWSWTLPGIEDPWTYTSTADLQRRNGTWQADLTPQVIEPDLTGDQQLSLHVDRAAPGSVTDRDGKELLGPHDVSVLGLDKSQLDGDDAAKEAAHDLADALGIDADRYAKTVAGYGEKAFVPALTVRKENLDDYPMDRARKVTGFLAQEQTQPLAVTKGYAPGVLGSVTEASAEQIEKSDGELAPGDLVASGGVVGARSDRILGTDGVTVTAEDPDAGDDGKDPDALFTADPTNGKDVETTLDDGIQQMATKRLADQDAPSAVVVMQPSTGDVLASAVGPTGQEFPLGLQGRYAPGSTFKTITALSLLRAGDTPDTKVQCPETAQVAGRSFKNADSMDPSLFGTMTLRTAIAHSCNTAMLLQHEKVDQASLAGSASALGIGQKAPEGLDGAFMGTVDPDDEGVEHAADMMGQGKVLASPLAMATVVSSVVDGKTVRPRVLADDDAKPEAPQKPLTKDEASTLQGLLRGVVTDGGLRKTLGDMPGEPVIGKTGTAEWNDEDGELRLHSWVIVAQGDLAVAVFVEDGSYGSVTAAPIARDVLEGAQGE